MRLNASNNAQAWVRTVPNTVRPVRLVRGRLSFSATEDEAVDLARKLVAAVDELRGES